MTDRSMEGMDPGYFKKEGSPLKSLISFIGSILKDRAMEGLGALSLTFAIRARN